jgi:hypothetical protein
MQGGAADIFLLESQTACDSINNSRLLTYRPHQGIWGSDEGLWYPYPTAVGPMPEHADRMVNASVELQLILWEISKAILADSGSFTPATANGYLRRLHNWAGNLPQSMSEVTQSGDQSLGILDLQ